MSESLKTWARGDMFIAQRLIHRLQRPRDALEADVANLLLSADKEKINLDENDKNKSSPSKGS